MKKHIYPLLILVGLTYLSPELLGQALDFDGVDDYAYKAGVITQRDNITIEAWVRPRENSGYNWVVCLDISALGLGTYNGNLFFLVNNSTANAASSQVLALNTWSHIALVRRNGTYELYYNGTNVTVGTNTTEPNITSGNLNISRGSGEIWQGGIDEVRIWSVARTAQQIADNYAAELINPASQIGLVAYYKMNEGVPGGNNTAITSLLDVSGNNHHATLNNFALTGATSNYIQGAVASACQNPTNGGTIGIAQTICQGTTPDEFTQTSAPGGSPIGTLQYKWQASTSSSSAGFADIDGATAVSYQPGSLIQTTWFKRLVKVDCESIWVESNVVEVTVNPLLQYRSKDGLDYTNPRNWTILSNWEQFNGTSWVEATSYPGQISNECSNPLVTIQTGHQMEIQTGSTIDIPNLKINGTGKLTIKTGGKIFVQDQLQLDQNAGGAIVVE